MSDNKRYYWLKLNESFFEDDTILWLEEQENGKEYVIFYLKLALRSLKDDGRLIRYVGEMLLPYDTKALSKLTSTNIDTVNTAMTVFEQIGLIERLNTGEIYMKQIDELIGSETKAAERMRKLRARERVEQLSGQKRNNVQLERNNVQESYSDVQNCDTEIEIEKELDKEIEIDKQDKKETANKLADKQLQDDFEKLWSLYPNKKGKAIALRAYKRAIKSGVTNKDIQTGIVNYKKEIEIKKTEPEYIAHGSTWFNQQRWGDDYDFTPPKPPTNYRGRSQHQEIIPEFMKGDNLQQSNESESEPMESEEELRKRLAEVFSEE